MRGRDAVTFGQSYSIKALEKLIPSVARFHRVGAHGGGGGGSREEAGRSGRGQEPDTRSRFIIEWAPSRGSERPTIGLL
jgi:hypothetical protein